MSAMNCKQARNLFDLHLDGDLEGELATELATHLLQCSDCRHELALQEVAGRVLQNDRHGEPVASDGFSDRLMACIDESPDIHVAHERRSWRMPWRVVGSVAALAACVAVAVWVVSWKSGVVAGFKEDATGKQLPTDKPADPISVDEATKALQESFEEAANRAREDVSSIGEAGRKTLEKTLDALNAAAEANSNGESKGEAAPEEPVEDF